MNNTSTSVQSVSLPHPVIVLGRDDSGKAHASFFPAVDAHSATQAASLMGMLALKADTDQTRAYLPRLPKGKLFDSGKAFVPFVKQELYQQIAAHLPEEQRALAERVRVAPEADPGETELAAKPTSLPADWDKLTIGSLVLATEGPLDGWYEATVIAIDDKNGLRLRWRDYLDMPAFHRRAEQIALIHPAYAEK
ncbi:hypothetical protein ACIQUB_07900 [Rhizobium sp. NPDC090275]|uniref:hypothetical protein n=1 Tax=Rhizobium sp. NPDC090275 TaxID=3364498 RepID=UPI00383A7C52